MYWFKCCHSFIYSISTGTTECVRSFIKNLLKRNKFIDVIIQTNSSYSGIYLISQRNALGVQLKHLVFSPVLPVMQKVQKLESINI